MYFFADFETNATSNKINNKHFEIKAASVTVLRKHVKSEKKSAKD